MLLASISTVLVVTVEFTRSFIFTL
jgi:hypothetical protein